MIHTPVTDADLHEAFCAGDYANAYKSEDFDIEAADNENGADDTHLTDSQYMSAFTLGFFASYTLEEMGDHAETYLEAYYSEAGQRVLALGYCDPLEQDEIEAYSAGL